MITDNTKKKFSLICDSIEAGCGLCLMEVKHKETGDIVNVICISRNNPDGTVDTMPFARFYDGNELTRDYLPPDSDGGFSYDDCELMKADTDE